MKRRLGFTLVEMVIVIAVIGILATVLVPTFGGIIDRANESTDVQTAGNLTTLIAMYGVDHKIETETDIANAINAGKNDPEFYQNLKAKSAKQGNCFWYEYSTGTVVVGTVEDIAKRAAEQAEPATMGPAGDATVDGGFRSYIVSGYLLMGQIANGNDLLDAVLTLESPGTDTYAMGIEKLYTLAAANADNAVMKTALEGFIAKTKQTVILTGFGLILPKDVTTVEKVHIPFGTVSLGNTSVHIVSIAEDGSVTTTVGSDSSFELVDSFQLRLPLGTQIGANVLNMYRNDSDPIGNPFMTGSDEIYVPATESELGNYFFADTTDAVIVLPNGDRYILNDANFAKLTAAGQVPVVGVTAPAYGTLESFGVGFDDGVDANYVVPKFTADNAYDLFISDDHMAGSITLTANNFQGTLNGQAATLPIRRINVGVTNADNDNDRVITHTPTGGLTFVISNFEDGDTITVISRDITYTYTVRIVDSPKFEVLDISNSTTTLVVKPNDITLNYALTHNSGAGSWVITPSFGYAPDDYDANGEYSVTLDTTLKVTSNLFNFDPETNTLTLKEALKGEASDTLTVTFENANRETYTVTVYVTLYDKDLVAFETNTNVTNMANKVVVGTDNKTGFVIGGQGNLTLGHLFHQIDENVTVNGVSLKITGSGVEIPVNDADWANYDLAELLNKKKEGTNDYVIPSGINLTFTLCSYETTKIGAEATVYFVRDAYNVSTHTEWKNTPDKVSIALIGDLTDENAIPGGTYTATKADGYAKDIGGKTIYGNLQTISVPDNFLVKVKAYNYLITTSGGKIDKLIVTGPDYGGMSVAVTGDHAASYGNYVSAVFASGTTTITDSFLSGFRSPIHAHGGTLTVKNSVLHLGYYANVYVDAKTTLNLTDVTTVQYKTAKGAIGAGIFFKHNSGKDHTVSATNLTQYNFVSQAEVQNIVQLAASIAGNLGSGITAGCGDFKAIGAVTHTIDGVPYYHMGIAGMWLMTDTDNSPENVTISGVNYNTDRIEVNKAVAKLYLWGMAGGQVNYDGSKETGVGCSTDKGGFLGIGRGCCYNDGNGCNHSKACTCHATASSILPSTDINYYINLVTGQ